MTRTLDAVPGFSDLPLPRRLRARMLAALQARLIRSGGGPARVARDRLPSAVGDPLRRALAPVRLPGPRAARLPIDAVPAGCRMPAGEPVASVVVPSRGAATLAQCLGALAAYTDLPCEVIVVVDAAPSTFDAARANATLPRLRIVHNASRRGFIGSANHGASLATAPVLVFLNDDAVVTPGWLTQLRAALDRPGAGLAGPASNDTGDAATVAITYGDLSGLLAAAGGRPAAPVRDVAKLSLFCAAMPRPLFEAVGGLDEGYGLGMFEDDELCMTLHRRGRRVTLVPGAFVHHHGSTSFGALTAAERIARFEVCRHRFERRWGVRWRAPR